MGKFDDRGNRGGGFGGRPSFNKKPWENRDNRGGDRGGDRAPQMHKATCANCGKTCEVPFRPNGEKPVYCSDCFGAMKEGNNPREERGGGRDFAPRREFTNDRPAAPYQKPAPAGEDKRIDNLVRQLDMANSKLDRLMDMVRASGRPAAPAESVKEKVSAPVPAPSFGKKVEEKKADKKAAAPAKKEVKKVAAKKVVAKKKK